MKKIEVIALKGSSPSEKAGFWVKELINKNGGSALRLAEMRQTA